MDQILKYGELPRANKGKPRLRKAKEIAQGMVTRLKAKSDVQQTARILGTQAKKRDAE